MRRRLRVVSWNVGRVYSPRGRNWLADSDVPRVVATLNELDPDVVLLQELANADQLARLMGLLESVGGPAAAHGQGYASALAERCSYDRQSAALGRRALLPAFEQLELGTTKRGVVACTFDLFGNERAVALSVHFDAFRRIVRRRQAEALVRLTDARTESVVFAGGDFNFDPALAARLGDPLDGGTAKLLRGGLVDVGATSGPTLFSLLRLDHMLVRGVAAEDLFTRVAPRRLPAGDHAPLVVDLHHRAASDS